MDQSLRDWYLATMGVVRYVPVRRSAASTDVVTAEACMAVPPSAGAELAPSADSARLKWPGGRHTGSEPVAPTAPIEGADASESAQPQPAFVEPLRLVFWQPGADLAVLDSLAPTQRPQVPELRLLENILKAIKRFSGELPAPEFIDWPPARSASADLAGARVYLNMFLDGRRRQQPFNWLLLMGSAAARMLCVDTGTPEVGTELPLACGATAIVVPGLEEMVEKPDLKASAWQAIRFLAGQA